LKAAETYEKIGDQLPSEKGSDVRYYVQAADEYGKARLLAANEEDKAELTDKQVDNLKKTARSLRALVKSGELTDEFRRVLLKSYEDILALYHDMSSADYKAKTLKYVAEGYVELRMPDTAVKTYQEALPLLASSALRAKGDIFFGIGKAEESKGPAGIQAAEAAYMKAKEFYVPAGADMSAQQAEDALKNLRETGTTPTPTPTPIPTPTPDDRRSGQGAGDTLKARLNGAFEGGGGPKGRAKFQVDEDEGVIEREFEVRVEQVDLPANTVLDVYVDGLRVGAITLRGDGKRSTLTLKSSDGVSVPQVNPYSRVVVTDSAGKVVVAGSFGEPPRISPQTR
jgi:hypothetical protein